MLINKNDKFSIRKFKNGRSDSVKIGAIGVIVGTAIALSAGANSAEAAMKENSDNTTTISNDKGSVIVDTANVSTRLQLIQLLLEQTKSLKLEK